MKYIQVDKLFKLLFKHHSHSSNYFDQTLRYMLENNYFYVYSKSAIYNFLYDFK